MNSFIWLEPFGEMGIGFDFYIRKDSVLYFQKQYDDVFIFKTVQEEYLCKVCYTTWDEEEKEIKAYESSETVILNMLLK